MRSSTGRRVGCSRSISRNPVTLPMLHLGCANQGRRSCGIVFLRGRNPEHALELVGENLDEARLRLGPVFQYPCGAGAAGEIAMTREQSADHGDILVSFERVEIDAGLVAAPGSEVAHVVVDVRDTSAHAGGEVAAG